MLHRFIWKTLNLSHPLSDETTGVVTCRCDRKISARWIEDYYFNVQHRPIAPKSSH